MEGRRMDKFGSAYDFDPFDDYEGQMKLPMNHRLQAETTGIASSSWMPKSGRGGDSLHDTTKNHLSISATLIRFHDTSHMGRHGCDMKSSHQKPLPLLPPPVKDDCSSIFETTDRGRHNVLTGLACYDPRPSSLLMQNPQTMKITRIFRGVYILFLAIRAMKSKRTLELEGLNNKFEGEKISQHLKLEELSDRLCCFCSLWPLDLEFHKDKCIQLWVAQGFFDFEFGRRIEVVTNEHFEDMLKKNFIVQSRVGIPIESMMYKVNNVVSSSSSSWVREDKLSRIANEVQHLFLLPEKFVGASFGALGRFHQLRTLILFCQYGNSIKYVPSCFFPKLPHLKILDLRATRISSLPDSIGDLLSLRYLDVSETRIEYLPETISKLRYLQTLKLESCSKFRNLPKCTNKLVNLRHLDLDIVGQLTLVPAGMGNLTSLQTLKGFIIGKDEGYRVGELKHLHDLRGSFKISRLDLISNVEEAREVEMYKKHLNKLELAWQQDSVGFVSVEDILEYLQPHLSLKELIVYYYYGSRFPTWMTNSCLPNIVSITLHQCRCCSYLPSLGGLQSLKTLRVVEMNEVRSIDRHFCRYWGRQIGPAFPKLEKLTFESMRKLESWTGVENGDFPCLLELTVLDCPKLVAIPVVSLLSSLKTLSICICGELQSLAKGKLPSKLELLRISNCPLVTKRCLKPQGEDWLKIKHIPSIIIDGEEMTSEASYGLIRLKLDVRLIWKAECR